MNVLIDEQKRHPLSNFECSPLKLKLWVMLQSDIPKPPGITETIIEGPSSIIDFISSLPQKNSCLEPEACLKSKFPTQNFLNQDSSHVNRHSCLPKDSKNFNKIVKDLIGAVFMSLPLKKIKWIS